MKTKYYMGRKNRRTNYRLYKKVITTEEITNVSNPYKIDVVNWFKADIPRGKFRGWNQCNQIPDAMKPIRPENAQEYLFLYSL